ncbi:BQ5605_C004g02647 [Microbotryum silenes-dioicae]|uniref:BQ5605_C004g02647 protein n=1 Tax=Microbotryum silenes-dioicae TaxID=796604 RepID=A0A2X0MCJ5_9BASI|nr:BQ5605_C004g02647 [Microbotryum silenes-dioicae]
MVVERATTTHSLRQATQALAERIVSLAALAALAAAMALEGVVEGAILRWVVAEVEDMTGYGQLLATPGVASVEPRRWDLSSRGRGAERDVTAHSSESM